MNKKTTCPEMEELRQLVADARPDLTNDFQDYLLELLWGMLAAMMRATDAPEGKKLGDLIQPFVSYFILSQGFTSAEDLKILDEFLFGKKRELPYGTIAVDANGIVTLVEVKE